MRLQLPVLMGNQLQVLTGNAGVRLIAIPPDLIHRKEEVADTATLASVLAGQPVSGLVMSPDKRSFRVDLGHIAVMVEIGSERLSINTAGFVPTTVN